MKQKINILYIIICTLCFYSGCFKVEKVPPPKPPYTFVTPHHLFGVATCQPHIWAVGFDGTIVHSSDGGITWEQQQSGVRVNLCDAFFVSVTHGWIVGRAGTMLHTTDGGTTWLRQDCGTSNHLFALCFVDQLYGWAVGDFGTIIHTTDGGTTWIQQGSGEDKIYNDVWFIDRHSGWVVGEYGTIYATQDGGATWRKQECRDIIPVTDETEWEQKPPSLYGVWFADTRRGFICGMDSTIIRTEDGGITWHKQQHPAEALKVTLYKICGSGATLVAVGQKGTSLVSRDGGITWMFREDATCTKAWLRDIALESSLQAWAVGSRGTILKSVDAGQTWTVVSGINLAALARE